ncbi:hypothetical protein GCM10027022_17380 [Alpinimonas psychrophila]
MTAEKFASPVELPGIGEAAVVVDNDADAIEPDPTTPDRFGPAMSAPSATVGDPARFLQYPAV